MTVGFSSEMAVKVMPVIGVIDVLVALLVLFKPLRIVFLWAALWAFLNVRVPRKGPDEHPYVSRFMVLTDAPF